VRVQLKLITTSSIENEKVVRVKKLFSRLNKVQKLLKKVHKKLFLQLILFTNVASNSRDTNLKKTTDRIEKTTKNLKRHKF